MSSPFDLLDACEARLGEAQRVVTKTRKIAGVVSGVAIAGGFGMLLWRVLGPEPEREPLETKDVED